jgi:hypothetical protein
LIAGLSVLYEDERVIAVDKPSGLAVHGLARTTGDDLVSRLRGERLDLAPVHRLESPCRSARRRGAGGWGCWLGASRRCGSLHGSMSSKTACGKHTELARNEAVRIVHAPRSRAP